MKISKLFSLLILFFLISSAPVLARSVMLEGRTQPPNVAPFFRVAYSSVGNSNEVVIEGALGNYLMCRERFGQYVIRRALLCSDTICRIVENSASSYTLKLESVPVGGWREWLIEQPQGCFHWEMTPQGAVDPYRRKIYIRKIPFSDDWKIEKEVIISGEPIREDIALVNFESSVVGEITDLVNFMVATLRYATICSADGRI